MSFESDTESRGHRDQDKKRYSKESLSQRVKNLWQHDPVRFVFWSGMAFVCSVVFMALVLEYSYRPQLCILCHEMKPAHETWKKSFHGSITGSKEDCLACHTKPGFGGRILAKLGGILFFWNHVTGNFDEDIKAELPVYCVRSGCHTDPWKMDRGSSIRVNHALHLAKGYACVVCHDRIAHGLDPEGLNLPTMKDFCFPCHNDEIASRSQCQYCHIYQDAMLQGAAGEGIPPGVTSVHRMTRLTCVDCHTNGCVPKPAQTCLECHPESLMQEQKQKQDQLWVSSALKQLEEYLPKLEEGVLKAEDMGQDISQINSIYNLAKDVYGFLTADASEGAHNPGYSRALLEKTLNRIDYAFLVMDQMQRLAF